MNEFSSYITMLENIVVYYSNHLYQNLCSDNINTLYIILQVLTVRKCLSSKMNSVTYLYLIKF